MWIARTIDQLRRHRASMSSPVAVVPTMGALHEGHLSLIDTAAALTDQVIVTIFVNPAQFGPGEDFQQYPRTLDDDLDQCRRRGVTGAFCPDDVQMYPPDVLECRVTVPALAGILEGAARPGHFDGVCRVVAKLFNLTRPDLACFGQKDLQQLRIIQAMVRDLNFPIQIVECPTAREEDGLALSSRNRYLGTEDRRHATGMYKALSEARMLVQDAGETDPTLVERVMKQVLDAHHIDVDYAAIRHPQTLAPIDCIEPKLTTGVAALVAGRLGGVHLIDNMIIQDGGAQDAR